MRTAARTIAFFAFAFLVGPAYAVDLSSCDGQGLERFIGKPVKAMKRVRKTNVRYVCSTCPGTMDFSAQRLSVVYDAKTGRVTEMSCN